MAHQDNIVNNVRKSRELILKDFNGNLDVYFKFLRQEESKNPTQIAKNIPLSKFHKAKY